MFRMNVALATYCEAQIPNILEPPEVAGERVRFSVHMICFIYFQIGFIGHKT